MWYLIARNGVIPQNGSLPSLNFIPEKTAMQGFQTYRDTKLHKWVSYPTMIDPDSVDKG